MKTWQVLVGATAIGLVVGFGVTAVEMYGKYELFFPAQYDALARQQEQADRHEKGHDQPGPNDTGTNVSGPAIEVLDGADYDFGTMERSSKRKHVFRIKNVGDQKLTIRAGHTTCKCTVSAVNSDGFAPGEIAEITVEWKGQTLASSTDFRQTVDLITNAPGHELMQLSLHGLVTETIRVLPEEIVAGQVSSNTGTETEFRLYGFRGEKIDIEEAEFEDAEVADKFAVEFEPLPKEEVEKEKGASCGLLGKLTLKPGLPLGPINQTIRIRAQIDKEATVHVPILGQVESDIIIASSPQFEPRKNLIRFGALKKGQSGKAVLQMYVKGAHRRDTNFSVGKIEPEGYFRVDIGPPHELNGGKTLRYELTIEIPAGLPPINRFGSSLVKYGRIVLETTHPQTKQVPFDVKFLVE